MIGKVVKNRAIDEVGNKYGRLTVIERTGTKYDSSYAAWLCKCECGETTIVTGSHLRTGSVRSCGCLHRETSSRLNSLPYGEASFNKLCYYMKRNAEKRNLEWALTKEQLRILTKRNCGYCGVEPRQVMWHKNCNGNYVYNGIDRMDNSKGYMIDNIVTCCKWCNQAKSNRTLMQFRKWIEAVYKHFIESDEGVMLWRKF